MPPTTARKRRIPKARVRLACDTCDRDDYDGITPARLRTLRKTWDTGEWDHIIRQQTWRQSIAVHDDPADAPPGYSVLDWWTHMGTCPECKPRED